MPIRSTETQLSLFEMNDTHWRHGSGLALRIRQSRRARRLILHVVPPGVLEVVVPSGVRPADVEAFVADNSAWIEAARRALGVPRAAQACMLPESMQLAAVGRQVAVGYDGTARPGVRLAGEDRLIVGTAGLSEAATRLRLRGWLLGEARRVLKPWLWREAARLEAEPKSVQVRLQRTRWGSCSSARRISLNAALLFVEPELVRYLLVHEICHLTHMNHSARFWSRVRRFEPACDDADRRLGRSWQGLPDWLFVTNSVQ
jgi:hypothetical protein